MAAQLKFQQYLAKEVGLSKRTLKYYRSDTVHFTGWLISRLRHWGIIANQLSEATPLLTAKLALEYKNFLAKNKTPERTVNRRLSTLRHLARFLIATQILDFDFMEGVRNIATRKATTGHPLVSQFERHLEAEKVSKNTIKSYLSDIKQFISWLENQTTT